MPFVLLVAPGFLLIALEPDLGTAGVYAAAALAIFFMAGANLVYLGAIGAGGARGRVRHGDPDTQYQLQRVERLPRPVPRSAGQAATTRSRA